jgi:hypothetical protein
MARSAYKAGVMMTLAVGADAAGMALDAINFEGGARLLVTASPISPSGEHISPQKLLLDTGSSTLAFCDSSLIDKVKSLQQNDYSCNIYGSATVKEGFWGPFYKGGVHIANGDIQVADASYSIMKQQVSMPCSSAVQGIFGIAFHQLDQATSEAPSNWPSQGVGSCPRPSTDFVQPLMQYLNSEGGVKQVGIYWSGKIGDGQGQLYLDVDATNNPHYDASEAASIGKASLGEFGWYDIDVQSVGYNGKSYTDIKCSPTEGSPCIMDTGTPVLVIPEDAYNAMAAGRTGELSVKLKASGGLSKPVELTFDAKTLLENNWVEPSPQAGVILGLPLRAFYYSVMDISDKTIMFSRMKSFMKAANETVVV